MGLSTHILDTALGRPVAGIDVQVSRWSEGAWQPISEGRTDADGRCRDLLAAEAFSPGVYRLEFQTGSYFVSQNLAPLYPFVQIVFSVPEGEGHFHIPLLLTANGYTTYRGS